MARFALSDHDDWATNVLIKFWQAFTRHSPRSCVPQIDEREQIAAPGAEVSHANRLSNTQ